jgi:hypothetical protein
VNGRAEVVIQDAESYQDWLMLDSGGLHTLYRT